jgi:O-acetyl-ADP-ribose deacetylase (regulator of RNase III)
VITYETGDITSTYCHAIAHGCNMRGKMGAGVALAIRQKYPRAYDEYLRLLPGRSLGDVITAECDGKLIGNLLTQDQIGRDGKRYASYPAVYRSLMVFTTYYKMTGASTTVDSSLSPIAIPKVGCGLGGLRWDYGQVGVKRIVEEVSRLTGVDFVVYSDRREDWK